MLSKMDIFLFPLERYTPRNPLYKISPDPSLPKRGKEPLLRTRGDRGTIHTKERSNSKTYPLEYAKIRFCV